MSIFHRIHWEQWHLIFPTIALFLIFGVFLLVIWRLWHTPQYKLNRLESLPLENEEITNEGRTQIKH